MADILVAKFAMGTGRRPKAFAKAASERLSAPELVSAIIAAAKLLRRVCTTEARLETSMFSPSGPAHSNVKLGDKDSDALSDTTRAPVMPVALTTRASASASTAS